MCIETANGVSLDYSDHAPAFEPSHYAFLVSEDEFDAIFARVSGGVCGTGLIRATAERESSMITDVASISRTRPATTWKS